MSETLTYDPTPESSEFTSDELNSLEVGEELMAQHEQLLAGKYKSAQELEQAYIELQRKLGDPSRSEDTAESEAADEETEEVDDKEEEPDQPAVTLITEASTEYAENGKLSPETMEKFSQMSSEDLVNAYVEMSAKAAQQQQQQPANDFSDQDVQSIKESVGGDEAYSAIVGWAADNLDPETIQAYDQLIELGSPQAIKLAVAGLKAQYEMSNGFEGELLTGKSSSNKADVFRSQAELVQAMADPRYDRDPAYRNDILLKLERSDLDF